MRPPTSASSGTFDFRIVGQLAADRARPEVLKLTQRRGVKGAGLHGARAEAAKPATQLTGGARGEGDGEHVRRRDHAGGDRERDAVGDRAGLARAGAGQDADRAANGFDRLALLGVERAQDVGVGGQGHRPILAGSVGQELLVP